MTRPGLALPIVLLLGASCGDDAPVADPPESHESRAIVGQGAQAMVVGSSGGPALDAGLQVMREGGNACDAALTAVLDQIVRAAGAWVSFGGYMTLVYFDAASGEVTTLSASYKTPLEETDPSSIPAQPAVAVVPRPRLPQVPRADEAARLDARTGKRRPLPGRDGRADRGAPPLTGARSPGTGRAACSAARRSVTRTTVRAAGCRRPRSGGREWGTGHGAAKACASSRIEATCVLP